MNRQTFSGRLIKHLMTTRLKTFKFIKAVSDIVFEMIKADYHDKPLICIRATSQEKLIYYHWAVNDVDSWLLMRWTGLKL